MKRRKPLKRRTPIRHRLVGLKQLKREAWQAIACYVRKRDPYCVTCLVDGKRTPTEHCGHYRHNSERNSSLGGNALWYDLRNLNGQCSGCNTFRGGCLDKYALYLMDKYGPDILKNINSLFRQYKKWTREEIQGIISQYA